MGVKDLWNLLTPHMERKPLFELSNKVVAIDLSGWVCESLNVVDYFVHPRFYLRNLFFRTCYLLQTGIVPVFVLEGTAPALKYGVIVKRNQMQFRGARPKKIANCDKATSSNIAEKAGKPAEQKRNRFHYVLKQCEELLNAMGLICVQAPGEAEALCAYLNQDNLIYGVISQDSDCFAYGAVRVFRNFCASQSGGSVDVYDLKRIDTSVLQLGQEKIVAMALLSGCDYCPAGVLGVGREMVTRFIGCYDNGEILPKMRSWRKTADRLTELEIRAEDKNICSDCGHFGKQLQHRKAGCSDCRTKPGCNELRWKQQRCNIKNELDIKRKALKDPDFPHEPIIDEFLTKPCELPVLDLSWRQPNLVKFIKSMSTYLQWNELYCFQKLLPLFTRWQVYVTKHPTVKRSSVFLEPDHIKKKRSPKGIASYEIVWKDAKNMFSGLIPQEQIDSYLAEAGNTLESLWSTIEPHDLVQDTYPELVEAFLASKTKGRKKKGASTVDGQDKPKKKAPTKKAKAQVPLKDFLAKPKGKNKTTETKELTSGSDRENRPNFLNLSSEDEFDSVDHFLNFTAELEAIAEDRTANDTFNSSALIDRLCRPNYLQQALEEYMQIIETEKRSKALQKLLSQSVAILPTMEPSMKPTDDHSNVQHRIVLKRDILNASIGGVFCVPLNQSVGQSVTSKKKRMSFFFEPIDIPPPEQPEGDNEPEEMDMFECTLMLKDQIVVEPCEDNDDINQTIIYDIDF
ncbi:flap endonuclease GEN [Anopheles moucheti]|uniref:flap endonuclease GEN n=1 Tax=Anopheles moucheti TaxID=186751 RepID=UPI0022F0E16A|nr:flap endonuclease GEN [Anopheles moucheti]